MAAPPATICGHESAAPPPATAAPSMTTLSPATAAPPPTASPPAAIKVLFDAAKQQGDGAYAAKEWDTALHHYARAMEADPDNETGKLHIVLSNIAAVHASQANWQESFHSAFEAVQVKQDFAKGHSRMGNALLAMNMLVEARIMLRKSLELDASNRHAWVLLQLVDERLTAKAPEAAPPQRASALRSGPVSAEPRTPSSIGAADETGLFSKATALATSSATVAPGSTAPERSAVAAPSAPPAPARSAVAAVSSAPSAPAGSAAPSALSAPTRSAVAAAPLAPARSAVAAAPPAPARSAERAERAGGGSAGKRAFYGSAPWEEDEKDHLRSLVESYPTGMPKGRQWGDVARQLAAVAGRTHRTAGSVEQQWKKKTLPPNKAPTATTTSNGTEATRASRWTPAQAGAPAAERTTPLTSRFGVPVRGELLSCAHEGCQVASVRDWDGYCGPAHYACSHPEVRWCVNECGRFAPKGCQTGVYCRPCKKAQASSLVVD